MKESLITLNTAKLAKEVGFDIAVFYHYGETPVNDIAVLVEPDNPQLGQGWILQNYNHSSFVYRKWSAPTQEILQKWLREKYNIHIVVWWADEKVKDGVEKYYFEIGWRDTERTHIQTGNYNSLSDTYEDALELGLQTALNKLKDRNSLK